jgi:hypothetical protein
LILSLLLLAGCAGLWVRSYCALDEFSFAWHGRGGTATSYNGAAVIGWMESGSFTSPNWHAGTRPTASGQMVDSAFFPRPVLGFDRYSSGRSAGSRYTYVRFPLWPVILAPGLASLWLWRRTRRHAPGFPVEVRTTGQDQATGD